MKALLLSSRKVKCVPLILIFLLLTATPALAGEPAAGITPGSPFYWFDRLAERVQLLFTFDPQAKVQALQKIGLERLAEAQEVQDPKTVGELISAYQTSQEEADELAGTNSDSLTTVSDGLGTAIAKLNQLLETAKAEGREKAAAAITRAIANLTRTSERLEKLAAKMPEKAKEKAAKAAEKAKKRLAKLEERLSKAKEEVEAKDQGGKKSLEELLSKVKEATAKHTAVLQRVLEKAPEPAKKALEKAVEKSQQGGQRAIEAIKKRLQRENEQPEVTGTVELQKEELKAKVRQMKAKGRQP